MIIVRYANKPAAAVFEDRIEFYPGIAALEPDHPLRRWVFSLAFFALRISTGHLPGPYTDERAAYFARCALLPDDEFDPATHSPDAFLAEQFNVPVEQVAEKRLDLRHAAPAGA